MKKVLLLTFILSTQIIALSQIGIGTKWIYNFNDFGINKPVVVEILSDTIINDIRWKILEKIDGCGQVFSNSAINQIDSKVYLIDLETKEEILLYDFDLEIGDSYAVKVFGIEHEEWVNIVAVDSISINGEKRKIQYIDNVEFGNYIIEGIGSNQYLVPQGNICDPHYYGLRCFYSENDLFDFDLNHDCDETYISSSINSIKTKQHLIQIAPNPTSGIVQLEKGYHVIDIYDLAGSKVRFTQDDNIVHTDNLPAGLYVLIIEQQSNKQKYVRKLLKK